MQSNTFKKLAACGLAVAAVTLVSNTYANAKHAEFKCEGSTACKGKGACKTEGANECKGQNGCAGQGFTMTKDEKACKKLQAKNKKHEAAPAEGAAAPAAPSGT